MDPDEWLIIFAKSMIFIFKHQKADNKIYVCNFFNNCFIQLYHIENSKIRG